MRVALWELWDLVDTVCESQGNAVAANAGF